MRYLIIYFILFLNLTCYAQVKNGVVKYACLTTLKVEKSDGDYTIDFKNKLNDNIKLIDFTLNFSEDESYFFVNPTILKGFSSEDEFCQSISIKSKFYNSLSKEEHKKYQDDELIGEYVMDYKQESKWTITKETKMIDGYLCYKATSPHYNEDGWNDNTKFLITAWYTPKIPVSKGPNGYEGLPGLILELQSYITTIYVKSIDLNLDKKPEINNLSNIRLLSIYQRDKLYKNAMSAEQVKWLEEQQAIIAKKKAEQEKANTVVAPKK